jgi:prevent-host-death family protein
MMRKTPRPVTTTVPAYLARTQLGSILRQVAENKARFVITKSGKPTAVLLDVKDFDDLLEEVDPDFQKSLKVAAKEFQAGRSITLKEYLKERIVRRAG